MIGDDDILRRLRAREREYRGTLLERVFADAADEIVRLRSGLDATAEFCAGYELAMSVSPEPLLAARPLDAWHEDVGPVLWWRVPIEEPPYVGSPLDDDWTDDYYTHWTPIVAPRSPT